MSKYGKLLLVSVFLLLGGIISLLDYYSINDKKEQNKKYEIMLIIITVLSFCLCIISFINVGD